MGVDSGSNSQVACSKSLLRILVPLFHSTELALLRSYPSWLFVFRLWKSLTNDSGKSKSSVHEWKMTFSLLQVMPQSIWSFSQTEIDCLQLRWRFSSELPSYPFGCVCVFPLPILCRRTDDSWSLSFIVWEWMADHFVVMVVMNLLQLCRYSCLNLNTCSFWVAFGVFVSRIFFETACFIAFLLIAHGYCIMHEQLAVTDRRSIAGLASLLYLTLTGYKAAVPQFAVRNYKNLSCKGKIILQNGNYCNCLTCSLSLERNPNV